MIYGSTVFKKSERSETDYIMYFEVNNLKELSLKDLKIKSDFSKEDEVKKYMALQRVPSPTKQKLIESPGGKIKGLNNKAVNAAIFIGGAILAAEVLGQTLK